MNLRKFVVLTFQLRRHSHDVNSTTNQFTEKVRGNSLTIALVNYCEERNA